MITGKFPVAFESGKFDAKIEINKSIYRYKIEFLNGIIASEFLSVNGNEKLTRDAGGEGKLFYASEKEFIKFKVPVELTVAFTRRDGIQHPYLIELNEWANSVILYPFGSDFGKSRVLSFSDLQIMQQQAATGAGQDSPLDDPHDLVRAYYRGYERYKEDFDKAIIDDMNFLGYNIVDVGAKHLTELKNIPIPAFGLFTVEADLGFKNPQTNMSQGMFRALALSIQMNLCSFSKNRKLILIDDIGEGLDFERSKAIINLLVSKAKGNGMQLIMTSNDRFVMNEVPLEHWSVMRRTGGLVRIFNERNSREQFENFKFVGLNNFDFFASDLFESGDSKS